jgi:copper chaperone CopZ
MPMHFMGAVFFKFILIIFGKFASFRSIQIFELTGNSEKMNISEVSSSLENIPLPPDQKKAILALIDAKINNDMKEVIAKLNELEGKLEVKIQMTNDKLSNEIKIVYWVIGIAMAVIMFVVARK